MIQLLNQVLYDYAINNVLSSTNANIIVPVGTSQNAIVDIKNNTRIIGTLHVTNDLTVATINVFNFLSRKQGTLTGSTEAGAEQLLLSNYMKCMKAGTEYHCHLMQQV